MNLTKHLPAIARITTPMAMVIVLTKDIYESQAGLIGIWSFLMYLGAAASSVGIEVVGILSGHTLQGFWKRRDWLKMFVAFILISAYTYISYQILKGSGILKYIPIIASIVYIVASLAEVLEQDLMRDSVIEAEQRHAEQIEKEKDAEFKRQQEAEEAAHKHTMELRKIELEEKLALAEIQVAAQQVATAQMQQVAQAPRKQVGAAKRTTRSKKAAIIPGQYGKCACGEDRFASAKAKAGHMSQCDDHKLWKSKQNGRVHEPF